MHSCSAVMAAYARSQSTCPGALDALTVQKVMHEPNTSPARRLSTPSAPIATVSTGVSPASRVMRSVAERSFTRSPPAACHDGALGNIRAEIAGVRYKLANPICLRRLVEVMIRIERHNAICAGVSNKAPPPRHRRRSAQCRPYPHSRSRSPRALGQYTHPAAAPYAHPRARAEREHERALAKAFTHAAEVMHELIRVADIPAQSARYSIASTCSRFARSTVASAASSAVSTTGQIIFVLPSPRMTPRTFIVFILLSLSPLQMR